MTAQTASSSGATWWQRFRRWLSQPRGQRRPANSQILFDEDGVAVRSKDLYGRWRRNRAAWDVVRGAIAFKRDCYIVDQICMQLELENGDWLLLHEEMHGWREFIEALPHHLPGAPDWFDWWGVVAFPAFATNPTELWPSFRAAPDGAA